MKLDLGGPEEPTFKVVHSFPMEGVPQAVAQTYANTTLVSDVKNHNIYFFEDNEKSSKRSAANLWQIVS